MNLIRGYSPGRYPSGGASEWSANPSESRVAAPETLPKSILAAFESLAERNCRNTTVSYCQTLNPKSKICFSGPYTPPFNGAALSDGSFSSSCTYPDHTVSLNVGGGELRVFGFRGIKG